MPQIPHTDSEPNPSAIQRWPRSRVGSWFGVRQNGEGVKALQFLPAYVAGGILIFFVLWALAGFLLPPDTPRLWGQLLAEAIFAVAAIAPAFAIARVEERPFGVYGLPGQVAFRKPFWAGTVWGLVSVSAILLILRLAGAISVSGIALHGARIGKFGLFWAAFFLLVAFFEEFAFRGYLLFAFSRWLGFWPAAVLSSIIFGFVHYRNPGENWTGALAAAVIGLFFCFTLRRTGSLWFAIGMHSAWDWSETFLYSVPDSGFVAPGHLMKTSLHGSPWLTGGSAGPEGSALLFIAVAVMCIAFGWIYPEVKYCTPAKPAFGTSEPAKL